MMDSELEVYSPEWFARLGEVEPQLVTLAQAAMRFNKGAKDGCCICGDTPATKSRLTCSLMPPILICEDCRKIRLAMHNEMYETIDNGSPQ